MLMSKLRPGGIKLIGETIRRVSRENIVGQIEAALVDDCPFSNEIKMITRHAVRTPQQEGRSGKLSISP